MKVILLVHLYTKDGKYICQSLMGGDNFKDMAGLVRWFAEWSAQNPHERVMQIIFEPQWKSQYPTSTSN